MKSHSIELPIAPEVEQLVAQLTEGEKETLSLLISAFVTRPKRTISQVMDDITDYAKKQGLNVDSIDDLLKDE